MRPLYTSTLLKTSIIFLAFLFTSAATYGNEEDIVKKKADFIIKVASSINYPDQSKTKLYKIGLYGKSRKINAIYEEIQSRKTQLTINGKAVELLKFRNTKRIEPVDLIYVEGNSKIRIKELNEQLAGHPYIIVTENFPFGMSMLNFAMNKKNELFFEIQENAIKNKGAKINRNLLSSSNRVTSSKQWQLNLESAVLVIQKHERTINVQTKEINKQDTVIKEQENTINLQTEEIDEKATVINSQRQTITVSLIFLLITSGLVFLLFRISRQRKKVLNELEQKNKEIISSIQYAKRIQSTILPSQNQIKEQFDEFFILYKPKDIVAGDFYWLEKEGGKIFFTVADCTGHGVPGAIISVMCSNALSKAVKELLILQPGKILDKTVELLEERMSNSEEDITDGMDLALCCLDPKTRKLEYSGANNPLYYISKGVLKKIKADRQPIGKYSERKPFTNHVLDVEKGDCIYIFSDGFADQFGGPNDKKFKYKPFRELLLANHNKPMEEQKQLLNKAFKKWKGELEQIDDICIIGLRV